MYFYLSWVHSAVLFVSSLSSFSCIFVFSLNEFSCLFIFSLISSHVYECLPFNLLFVLFLWTQKLRFHPLHY
jgi:hypothetical protein